MHFGANLDARRHGNALSFGVRSADEPSRREKAFAAIEGHENGTFERNPWVPIQDFDASVKNEIEVHGGLVFTFELSDPISFSDTDRLAALWDDEVVADGPKVVRQGSRVTVTVPEVKGDHLSLWATSSLTPIEKDRQPLANLAAVRAREGEIERQRAAASDEKGNPFTNAINGFFGAQKAAGVVFAVGVCVVGYFLLKDKV